MMKNLLVACLLMTAFVASAKDYKATSPDGKTTLNVSVEKEVNWSVSKNEQLIIAPSAISLSLNDGKILGKNTGVLKVYRRKVNKLIEPIVKRKYAQIKDEYNEMELKFPGRYSLVFRVYDEGVAYRWKTDLKKDIIVKSEEVNFNFEKDYKIWFPEEESMYSHQERGYLFENLSAITPERFCSTGTLVDFENGTKVFLSEADLEDYPGLFLEGSKKTKTGLSGKFAGVPLETEKRSDRDVVVTKYADYMAKTKGSRVFPWRLAIITQKDAELVESELVYKLSKPLAFENTDWIKPGKVAWDWWNACNIYGVDFEAGVNTETYKYFIDFAAEYGLEYIVLDEGWYHLDDIMKIKKEVDLEALFEYGKKKKVNIILWVTWKALEDKADEAFKVYSAMGAKGFKVDFMQRDDQWMVNYYHRIAKQAAEYKMLIDYHGSYKPAGLRRAYPNVITREGVRGMEQSKWGDWANPEHDLILPFTRMVSGPMDYTPGAMINANKRNFKPVFTEPMSQGTRCHQLAMYVVYESPLQMLSDNPSNYYKEPECMEFLSPVPTVWDDTKVLDAKISDYILMARQSGDVWYMGAMTDWTAREMTASFDFLDVGEYTIEIWQDGVNADKHAGDYKKVVKKITKDSKLKIKMAPGGGWAAIIKK
jgi:alpha-glucosidase